MKQKFTIDQHQPGSILRDFHSLLAFIGSDGQLVSKKMLIFAPKTLIEFNQKMTKPVAQDKKRPSETTFPHIAALHQCARLLGFLQYRNEKTRKRITLNPEAMKSWQQLNPTEQYFTLLEQWLYGDQNERGYNFPPVDRLQWFQTECLKKTKAELHTLFKKEYQIGELLAGLELFGLVEIKHIKPDAGGGWKISALKLTQMGRFVLTTLTATHMNADDLLDRFFSKKTINTLFKNFQPHFPELKKPYAIKASKTNRTGTYIFKVSLQDAWRRIAVTHPATLEELAGIILDNFGFYNDHLHSFTFIDTTGTKQEYLHPRCMDVDTFTDEITLAQLPLSIKGSMTFIFDFGDWWEFNVLLEKIDDHDVLEANVDAKLLDEKGVAPDQYPDWDEEY